VSAPHDRVAGQAPLAARPGDPPSRPRRRVGRWLPVLEWLPHYRRSWLREDLAAGLALTALLVPQGMAYAQLAGLPPITGLYTSVTCLLAYAVAGPSRVLVLGPDSSLGPMIAATVLPLLAAGRDPARAVVLASALSIMIGLFMTAAGVARLGFVADLLSKPTQIGYLNGLALTILIGQTRTLLGFSVDADGVVGDLVQSVQHIVAGAVTPASAGIGLASLVVLLVLTRTVPRFPAVLLTVVAATLASAWLDLSGRGVAVVGALPGGLPPLRLPLLSPSDLGLLVAGALGITLVALADTISTASAYARRAGADVDGNQEMIGIGLANVASGLFQGFAVSTSGSRTAVAFQAGARTQVSGVVAALAILTLLVAAPGALTALPVPTLAAIVVVAAISMADVATVIQLWSQRRTEFWLSLAATAGVAVLGVLPGIAVAVGLSILNVFRRTWWPYQAVLGRAPGVAGYHDVSRYPQARRMAGLVVFRFDAPLIFANARTFAEQVAALTSDGERPRWVIIAAEPITDIDITAADMLLELVDDLAAHDTRLVFAELKDPVRAKLEQYGLTSLITRIAFYPTLNTAGKAYRAEFGTDWEVRAPTAAPSGP